MKIQLEISAIAFGRTMLVFSLLFQSAYAQQVCSLNTDGGSIAPSTPVARFVLTEALTVIDKQTRLMWAKCPQGRSGSNCHTGSANLEIWADALNSAESSTLAGFDDWRLPNIKELMSIIETACLYPSIQNAIFPNTDSTAYWSASPHRLDPGLTWVGLFSEAVTLGVRRNRRSAIRLVRDF